jgi:hypothetical protein
MRSLEALVEEVRSLPVPERLRLVERIVHELAEVPAVEPAPRTKVSPLGWLADEPELADQLEKLMLDVRARGRARGPEDDEDPR